MFDNLRDDNDPAFYEEDDTIFPEENAKMSVAVVPKRKSSGKLLGMTPIQRFIIAVMLLLVVCMLGTMCLFLTGRIGLF